MSEDFTDVADSVLLDVLALSDFILIDRTAVGRFSVGRSTLRMVYLGRRTWPVRCTRPSICIKILMSPAACATIMWRWRWSANFSEACRLIPVDPATFKISESKVPPLNFLVVVTLSFCSVSSMADKTGFFGSV